jgi:hypothetical protein
MSLALLKKKINKYTKKISLLKGGTLPINDDNTINPLFQPLFKNFSDSFNKDITHNPETTPDNENEIIYYLLLLLFIKGDNLPIGLNPDNFNMTLNSFIKDYDQVTIFDHLNISKSFGEATLIKHELVVSDTTNKNIIGALPITPKEYDINNNEIPLFVLDNDGKIFIGKSKKILINTNYLSHYSVRNILNTVRFFKKSNDNFLKKNLFIIVTKNIKDITDNIPSIHDVLDDLLNNPTNKIEPGDYSDIIFISPTQPLNEISNEALRSSSSDDLIFWLLSCSLYNMGYREKLILLTADKQKYFDDKSKNTKNLASEMIDALDLNKVIITKITYDSSTGKNIINSYSNNGIHNLLNQVTNIMRTTSVRRDNTADPNSLSVFTNLSQDIYNEFNLPTSIYVPKTKFHDNFKYGFNSANYCSGLTNIDVSKSNYFSDKTFENLAEYMQTKGSKCDNVFFEQFITYIKYIQHKMYPVCNGSVKLNYCSIDEEDFINLI